MSLHALQTAVMRIVKDADVGTDKELEALRSASNMYYLVALIAAAVYEHLRVEQQRHFATAYEFGISLSRSLDLGDILDITVHKVAEYTKGNSVAILLTSPEKHRDETRAYHNLDEEVVDAIPDICESLGCGKVDEDGQDQSGTNHIASDIRTFERLARWAGLLASHGSLSIVCAPLLAKQKRLGSIVVLWPEPHTPSGSEMDFLFALASHAANAVQNAILYEEAQRKRELGVLLEASRLFSSSLDTGDILRKMARMATEAVGADLAVVLVLDRLQQERSRHIAHYTSSRKATDAILRIMEVVAPEGEESGLGILEHDFANRQPILFCTAADLPEGLQSLIGTIESGLIVPLIQKDVLLGAFALMSLDQNSFSEGDISLATGLADLAAVAIDNARLYEYERNIAETLQRSFLPSSFPDIEGYDTAAYYRSAMAEAEVGGDFYDVFAIGGGNMGVVIGDVSGKGLNAAVSTAMGKYMLRAYAAENPSPSNVLTRFNLAFCENVAEYSFMTAFYGTLDPTDNVFTYVSAGHDPPLLYSSATDRVMPIQTAGLCLGVSIKAEYIEKKVQLQPGDVLFLYTDGATDVKEDGDRLDLEGLQRLLLSSARGTAEQIVRDVSNGILRYSHGRLTDDVALVALKRVESTSSVRNADDRDATV
jgi:GAF domain-containing protein